MSINFGRGHELGQKKTQNKGYRNSHFFLKTLLQTYVKTVGKEKT